MATKSLEQLKSYVIGLIESNIFLSAKEEKKFVAMVPTLSEARLKKLAGIFVDNEDEFKKILEGVFKKDPEGELNREFEKWSSKQLKKIYESAQVHDAEEAEEELLKNLKQI